MGGYVYLICDPNQDAYKIGVTRHITSNRIKKLQTGNATELHMVTCVYCDYPFRLESMLHNHFKNKKILGEWYKLEYDDICRFEDICSEKINIIDSLKDNIYFGKNLK